MMACVMIIHAIGHMVNGMGINGSLFDPGIKLLRFHRMSFTRTTTAAIKTINHLAMAHNTHNPTCPDKDTAAKTPRRIKSTICLTTPDLSCLTSVSLRRSILL